MKKKILGVALIATMAVAAGWNFNQSKNETGMSNIALANVEALAYGEGIYTHGICYQSLSFEYVFTSHYVIYCMGCKSVKAVLYSNASIC